MSYDDDTWSDEESEALRLEWEPLDETEEWQTSRPDLQPEPAGAIDSTDGGWFDSSSTAGSSRDTDDVDEWQGGAS